MWLFVLMVGALGVAAAGQTGPPGLVISIGYDGANENFLRQDLAIIRRAGFNAVTTTLTWREGEPSRGSYSLRRVDRLVAAASAEGLKTEVEVHTQVEPPWKLESRSAIPAAFYEYVRRRLSQNPDVVGVVLRGSAEGRSARSVTVGDGAGGVTLLRARLEMWRAVADGARRIRFFGLSPSATAQLTALGDSAGVITRNVALFAPLQRRNLESNAVVVSPALAVSVHILESSQAMAIVALNHAPETRRVSITFPPEIPEAIWQNMEAGVAVHFVMGPKGPVLEHTFAPHDILVLAIRKKLR